MSESKGSAGLSPALAAFISAVVSVTLTIAGTLVSQRFSASQGALFLVLTWLLITMSITSGAVALWVLANSIRKNIQELAHLRSLEACIPQLIRFRRRQDNFILARDGNAFIRITCDVESGNSAVVPSISFPMIAEVLADYPEWSSIVVRRVCVDGAEFDPTAAFERKERTIPADSTDLGGRVVESGIIRVPVSLGHGRTRCSLIVEAELIGAFTFIGREENCYSDVPYVTDELNMTIMGQDGFKVTCSPYSQHRVRAIQLGMEILDLPESLLQSGHCQILEGVRWTTTNAKLGYRYAIPVRGES